MTDRLFISIEETSNIFYELQFCEKKTISDLAKKAIDYIWKELVNPIEKPRDWRTISFTDILELKLPTTYPKSVDRLRCLSLSSKLDEELYGISYGLEREEGHVQSDQSEMNEVNFWQELEDINDSIREICNFNGSWDNVE